MTVHRSDGLLPARLLLDQRHPEPKARPAAGTVRGLDTPAVRFQNGACNRQTHAGALALARSTLAAIELLEDQRQIPHIDPRAVIFHVKLELVFVALAPERHAAARGRVRGDILE